MTARQAFVSGGTGAIGSAIVRRLATDGFAVTFTYAHSAEEARRLASDTGSTYVHLDLMDEWEPPAGLSPEILVHNAGVNLSGCQALHTQIADLRSTMQINVESALRLSAWAAEGMASRGWGRIISINSLYGLQRPAGRLSYTISKFSLRALTGTLALELGPRGITVNEICPGPVDSRMLRSMGNLAVEQGRADSVESYLVDVAKGVPTGRLVAPEDVAHAVSFIASPHTGSINGVSLPVDGGLSV